MLNPKLFNFQNYKFLKSFSKKFSSVNSVNISDPFYHLMEHTGSFYKIPETDFTTCFEPVIKNDFVRLLRTIDDKSIIIRKPAVEVINFLKSTDFDKPIIRFLFYGRDGAGKTVSMAHIFHYAFKRNDWLLLYFPNPFDFLNLSPEMNINSNDETLYDTPTLSGLWLNLFLKMNSEFLKKYNPKTLIKIQWNQNEDLPAGSTWTEMINFVISRPKYTSDCIGILLREAREHAKLKEFKVLGAIRGVNCLFQLSCKGDIAGDYIPAERIAVLKYWRRFLKNDWYNGSIISSVNLDSVYRFNEKESYFPKYLLGKQGFKELDPFVPIFAGDYSNSEVSNYLNFLNENHWLTIPEAKDPNGIGRREIAFLSDNHPGELFNVTREW